MFDHRTPASLAIALEHREPWQEAEPEHHSAQEAPASHGQASLWFQQKAEPEDYSYNIAWSIDIRNAGAVSIRAAWQAVGYRQLALRTRLEHRHGRLLQVLDDQIADLVEVDDAEALETASRCPFDPDGPLVRGFLVPSQDGGHRLGVVAHHAVLDDCSIGVWYEQFAASLGERKLAPTPGRLSDLGARQRRLIADPIYELLLARWRQALDGAPHVLDLPLDFPRPITPARSGATLAATLPAADRAALARLCQKRGATVFAGLAAAFEVLVYRLSGQTDFLIGCPVNIREPDDAGVIGNFTNLLPLRAELSPDLAFPDLVEQVRARTLMALECRAVPFPNLVHALQVKRSPGHHPLVQVMFNYLRRDLGPRICRAEDAAGDGPHVSWTEVLPDSAKFDMTLEIIDQPDEVLVRLNYATSLFEPDTASEMLQRYLGLVAAVVTNPDGAVGHLPALLPGEEQRLGDFNPPPSPASGRSVHDRIDTWCREKPDVVAIISGEGACTFGEMDRLVADLAAGLREAGVGRELRSDCFLRHPSRSSLR